MKLRIPLLFLSLPILFALSSMNAQGLESYQWKNRILLLKDVKSDTDAVKEQLQLLRSEDTGLTERDLKIFIITEKVLTGDGEEAPLSASEIIKNFDLHDFQGIVLIGKDGGQKMKKPFVLAPEEIFALIDGMPMRRSEIRKKGE
ncbi:DUF4174 domain-containing protein [Maribacter halichondriae]|uniref:DUF4174 domain-containing protein n=1 Tax=Maribacter halichondriae TaxID=2980554 RepID=UPI002358CF9B|nr:DUF4174 domain-containing protein [Maribacter sp. Hal144]